MKADKSQIQDKDLFSNLWGHQRFAACCKQDYSVIDAVSVDHQTDTYLTDIEQLQSKFSVVGIHLIKCWKHAFWGVYGVA